MRYTDKFLVVDLETDNTQGHGLSYFRKDYKVISASVQVVDGAGESPPIFYTDMEVLKNDLNWASDSDYTFLVYNAGFDCGVMKHHLGIRNAFNAIDVWRLFNYTCLTVTDKFAKAGDDKRDTKLNGAVKYLFGVKDYKAEFLDYFIEKGLAKNHKDAHAMVAQLPPDLLERYNNADTEWTWKVYKECVRRLESWGIDWRLDHWGYIWEAELYSDAFVRGITIDRDVLSASVATLTKEIKAERKALMDVPEVIEAEKRCNQINVKLTKPLIRKWKDAHGLDKSYVIGEAETEAVIEWRRKQLWKPFNFRSGKQKQVLFLEVMALPIEKLTKKGNPEISKKTLGAYGKTGKQLLSMLLKMKELDECLALLELSEYDGKLHASLRSGSTVSGRSSSKVD
jgi:hypothetical protein